MAKVRVCPKTDHEINTASKKLECGNDRYGNNQYLCIPNVDKTSLVEFCDDGEMGVVEEGNCLEASLGRVIQRKCLGFASGCPNTTYDKNTVYKYPACQEINTVAKCYVADPSCQLQAVDDLSNNYAQVGIVVAAIIGIIGIIGITLVCYCWRKKESAIYQRIMRTIPLKLEEKSKDPERVTSEQDEMVEHSTQIQPITSHSDLLQTYTEDNNSPPQDEGNYIIKLENVPPLELDEKAGHSTQSQPITSHSDLLQTYTEDNNSPPQEDPSSTHLSGGGALGNLYISLESGPKVLYEIAEHSSPHGGGQNHEEVLTEDKMMEHSSPNSEKNNCREDSFNVTVKEEANIGLLCFPRNKNLILHMDGKATIGTVCEAADWGHISKGPTLTKDLGNKHRGPSLTKDFKNKEEAQIPTKDFGNKEEALNLTKDLGDKNGGPSVTKDVGNTGRQPDPNEYFGNDEAEKRQQPTMATTSGSSEKETPNKMIQTAAIKPLNLKAPDN